MKNEKKLYHSLLSGFLQWTGIFVSVAILSSAFAAYSALQTVGTASPDVQLSSAEWNKMVSNFASVDSQLSSLSSVVEGLGTLASKSSVDTADIANSAVTDAKVASGISPSKLAQSSATSGQVLKWNGTSWAPAADGGGAAHSVRRVTANSWNSVSASCNSTTEVLVGGWCSSTNGYYYDLNSYPANTVTWTCSSTCTSECPSYYITAYALCLAK